MRARPPSLWRCSASLDPAHGSPEEHVYVGGADILALNENALRSVRGQVDLIRPSKPFSSALSRHARGGPGREMVDAHLGSDPSGELLDDAWAAAQLPDTGDFRRRFPHELSGGQQQRVAIAMALVCKPKVIVMDEPTTGLDVLTQERLLRVIGDIRKQRETSIVYISHDLGVVRNLVDDVAVMYGGRIVEHAPVDDALLQPTPPVYAPTARGDTPCPAPSRAPARHRGPCSRALEPSARVSLRGALRVPRRSMRRRDAADVWERPPLGALLADRRASRPERDASACGRSAKGPGRAPAKAGSHAQRSRAGRRLSNGSGWHRRESEDDHCRRRVSFDLLPGTCLAVVGESGSGKTTLARCLAGLHDPLAGELRLSRPSPAGPGPTPRAGSTTGNPDRLPGPRQLTQPDHDRGRDSCGGRSRSSSTSGAGGDASRPRVTRPGSPAALDGFTRCPVSSAAVRSNGWRSHAPSLRSPRFSICDEVTSALDVAVQASILELLEELRVSTGMSMLFVSHDLAVVRTIADHVLVMKAWGGSRARRAGLALHSTSGRVHTAAPRGCAGSQRRRLPALGRRASTPSSPDRVVTSRTGVEPLPPKGRAPG